MSLVAVLSSHPRLGDLHGLATDGRTLLGVGGAPTGTVRVSSNLNDWEGRPAPPRGLRGVAKGPFGWVAVGEYGWIGVSTDDGQTWTAVPHAAPGCLHSVAVDGPGVWIVGEGGQLLGLAEDHTLRSFDTGTTARLSAVHANGNIVWMGGHDGVLLKRETDVQHSVKLSDQPLTRICVAGDGAVVVTGDGGRIFRAPDGEAWADVSPDGYEDIEDVAVLGDGVLLAVGATFSGKTYLATYRGIYCLSADQSQLLPIQLWGESSPSTGILHAAGGSLWSVGPKDIAYSRDGEQWQSVHPEVD